MPKPDKPYPDFPLFPHANGQWAKKIKGIMTYFGPWADWQAALRKYNATGDTPNSLKACIDKYVESRRLLQASGEISYQHFKDIERTLASLSVFVGPKAIAGLTSADYGAWRAHVAETNGPVALGNHIMRVRAFLNWCKREGIIKDLPAGDSLKKPSRAQLRKARAARGSKMFTPDELRRLITCAGASQLRAMIYLGLNAGLGPNDLALLQTHNIKGEWLDYPRPKTGIERRVPLWPETRAALAAVIRPDDEVVFRTAQGNLWTCKCKSGTGSPISQKFTKLCQGVGVHKPGRGFYSLRHVCKTIGEESGDQAAIEYIMGHAPPADDMSSIYRERMADKRLFKVVKHIRRWLQPWKIGKGTDHAPVNAVNVEPNVDPELLEIFGSFDTV